MIRKIDTCENFSSASFYANANANSNFKIPYVASNTCDKPDFISFAGRVDYTENEKSFEKFKTQLMKKFHKIKAADLIADDLINLVKKRNEFAQKFGYSDFFSFELEKTYGVDEKELFKLLEKLDKSTYNVSKKMVLKEQKKLAN